MSGKRADRRVAAQREKKLGRGSQRYRSKTSIESRTERTAANERLSRFASAARAARARRAAAAAAFNEQSRSEGPSPEKTSDASTNSAPMDRVRMFLRNSLGGRKRNANSAGPRSRSRSNLKWRDLASLRRGARSPISLRRKPKFDAEDDSSEEELQMRIAELQRRLQRKRASNVKKEVHGVGNIVIVLHSIYSTA